MKVFIGGRVILEKYLTFASIKDPDKNKKLEYIRYNEYNKLVYMLILLKYIGRLGQKTNDNTIIDTIDFNSNTSNVLCNVNYDVKNPGNNYSIIGEGSFKAGVKYMCDNVQQDDYIITVVKPTYDHSNVASIRDIEDEINGLLLIATSGCPFISQLIGFVRFYGSTFYFINNQGTLSRIPLISLHRGLCQSKFQNQYLSSLNKYIHKYRNGLIFDDNNFDRIWANNTDNGAIIIIEKGNGTIFDFFEKNKAEVYSKSNDPTKKIWLRLGEFIYRFYYKFDDFSLYDIDPQRIYKIIQLLLAQFILESCLPFYYLHRKGYTHGDYKWDNVMYKDIVIRDSHGNYITHPDGSTIRSRLPILIDFGMLSNGGGNGNTWKLGALAFRPQRYRHYNYNNISGVKHDKKVDIYCFTTVLKYYLIYELNSSLRPSDILGDATHLSDYLVGQGEHFLFNQLDTSNILMGNLLINMCKEEERERADPTTIIKTCWDFIISLNENKFVELMLNKIITVKGKRKNNVVYRTPDNEKIFGIDHFPQFMVDILKRFLVEQPPAPQKIRTEHIINVPNLKDKTLEIFKNIENNLAAPIFEYLAYLDKKVKASDEQKIRQNLYDKMDNLNKSFDELFKLPDIKIKYIADGGNAIGSEIIHCPRNACKTLYFKVKNQTIRLFMKILRHPESINTMTKNLNITENTTTSVIDISVDSNTMYETFIGLLLSKLKLNNILFNVPYFFSYGSIQRDILNNKLDMPAEKKTSFLHALTGDSAVSISEFVDSDLDIKSDLDDIYANDFNIFNTKGLWRKFYDVMGRKITKEDFEIITLQLLYFIYTIQEQLGMTHFDMHSPNLLIKRLRDDDMINGKKVSDIEYFCYKIEGVKTENNNNSPVNISRTSPIFDKLDKTIHDVFYYDKYIYVKNNGYLIYIADFEHAVIYTPRFGKLSNEKKLDLFKINFSKQFANLDPSVVINIDNHLDWNMFISNPTVLSYTSLSLDDPIVLSYNDTEVLDFTPYNKDISSFNISTTNRKKRGFSPNHDMIVSLSCIKLLLDSPRGTSLKPSWFDDLFSYIMRINKWDLRTPSEFGNKLIPVTNISFGDVENISKVNDAILYIHEIDKLYDHWAAKKRIVTTNGAVDFKHPLRNFIRCGIVVNSGLYIHIINSWDLKYQFGPTARYALHYLIGKLLYRQNVLPIFGSTDTGGFIQKQLSGTNKILYHDILINNNSLIINNTVGPNDKHIRKINGTTLSSYKRGSLFKEHKESLEAYIKAETIKPHLVHAFFPDSKRFGYEGATLKNDQTSSSICDDQICYDYKSYYNPFINNTNPSTEAEDLVKYLTEKQDIEIMTFDKNYYDLKVIGAGKSSDTTYNTPYNLLKNAQDLNYDQFICSAGYFTLGSPIDTISHPDSNAINNHRKQMFDIYENVPVGIQKFEKSIDDSTLNTWVPNVNDVWANPAKPYKDSVGCVVLTNENKWNIVKYTDVETNLDRYKYICSSGPLLVFDSNITFGYEKYNERVYISNKPNKYNYNWHVVLDDNTTDTDKRSVEKWSSYDGSVRNSLRKSKTPSFTNVDGRSDGFEITHAGNLNPRCVIGIDMNDNLVVVHVSGRALPGVGMDLATLAHYLGPHGLKYKAALTLDAGGSMAMSYKMAGENCCSSLFNASYFGIRGQPVYLYIKSKLRINYDEKMYDVLKISLPKLNIQLKRPEPGNYDCIMGKHGYQTTIETNISNNRLIIDSNEKCLKILTQDFAYNYGEIFVSKLLEVSDILLSKNKTLNNNEALKHKLLYNNEILNDIIHKIILLLSPLNISENYKNILSNLINSHDFFKVVDSVNDYAINVLKVYNEKCDVPNNWTGEDKKTSYAVTVQTAINRLPSDTNDLFEIKKYCIMMLKLKLFMDEISIEQNLKCSTFNIYFIITLFIIYNALRCAKFSINNHLVKINDPRFVLDNDMISHFISIIDKLHDSLFEAQDKLTGIAGRSEYITNLVDRTLENLLKIIRYLTKFTIDYYIKEIMYDYDNTAQTEKIRSHDTINKISIENLGLEKKTKQLEILKDGAIISKISTIVKYKISIDKSLKKIRTMSFTNWNHLDKMIKEVYNVSSYYVHIRKKAIELRDYMDSNSLDTDLIEQYIIVPNSCAAWFTNSDLKVLLSTINNNQFYTIGKDHILISRLYQMYQLLVETEDKSMADRQAYGKLLQIIYNLINKNLIKIDEDIDKYRKLLQLV